MNLPFAAGLVLASALFTPASPALSHTRLVGAFPAQNAHVSAPVTKVELRFAGRADAHYSFVEVKTRDGTVLASGIQPEASRSMSLPTPPLRPGRYSVEYRVLSTDGDIVTGALDFFVD